MGIDWSKVTNCRLEYFRSRCMSCVEADIAGWHYWAFYSTAPLYNETDSVKIIEGVFFAREKAADINSAFHVPGAWLHQANGTVYNLLLDKIKQGS